MSKVSQIKAELRQKLGTQATKKCRQSGMLPGVIYGHKLETVSIAVPELEFLKMFRSGAHVFELQMEGKSENVLIKSIQYNYLGTEPIHIDFNRVDLNERVHVQVPIVLKGTPVGVQAGGIMRQSLQDVEIECIVTDIPENIRLNVSDVELDQSLHASDIKLPAGATLITDVDAVILTVAMLAEEVEAEGEGEGEAGAAGAEPEVINRGKEEEGEAEAK